MNLTAGVEPRPAAKVRPRLRSRDRPHGRLWRHSGIDFTKLHFGQKTQPLSISFDKLQTKNNLYLFGIFWTQILVLRHFKAI
jgi:hypothetical protein